MTITMIALMIVIMSMTMQRIVAAMARVRLKPSASSLADLCGQPLARGWELGKSCGYDSPAWCSGQNVSREDAAEQ